MSVEQRKNIDKWQSGKDILVNAQPDIVEARRLLITQWPSGRLPGIQICSG
jgi:hypothetical protein